MSSIPFWLTGSASGIADGLKHVGYAKPIVAVHSWIPIALSLCRVSNILYRKAISVIISYIICLHVSTAFSTEGGLKISVKLLFRTQNFYSQLCVPSRNQQQVVDEEIKDVVTMKVPLCCSLRIHLWCVTWLLKQIRNQSVVKLRRKVDIAAPSNFREHPRSIAFSSIDYVSISA